MEYIKRLGLQVKKVKKETVSALKGMLCLLFYFSGVLNLYRFLRGVFGEGEVKILAYHNINNQKDPFGITIPESLFQRQLQYLQKKYPIISLSEAVEILREKKRLRRDVVVITFDDGYLDNYTFVFPIVRERNVPITLFLTVNPVEEKFPLAVEALSQALDKMEGEFLDLTLIGLEKYPLRPYSQKETTIRRLDEFIKNQGEPRKRKIIESILKKADMDLPIFRKHVLSWEQVKEMSEKGIQIGSHTLSHPMLSRTPSDDAWVEIRKSKETIEQHIKQEVRFFAYPYGDTEDFTQEHVKMVENSGYQAACSLIPGTNDRSSNLFVLRRINVNSTFWTSFPNLSLPIFAMELSGIFDRILFRSIRRPHEIGHSRASYG